MSLFTELKRRNVFRVGAAYAVVAWLIVQVGDVAADNLGFPDWFMPMLFVLLALGFPVAVFLAWAFELTPGGMKREKEVAPDESIAPNTGRKLDRLIIGVLVLAVAVLVGERFWPRTSGPADAEIDQSIAVLLFDSLSDEPEQGYFADGLTEEILNALAALPELLVTARTSSFFYKGKDVPVDEIDARPAGPLQLMILISNCACGAPFALDATPNLAARLAEAALEWPPIAPIDWPLKDW